MIVRITSPVFKTFPELAEDQDRFLYAIRAWKSSPGAIKHGVKEARFYVTKEYEPVLEFSIDVQRTDDKSDKVEVFFPADDLVLFVGSKVLDKEGQRKLTDKVLDARRRSGPAVFQRYVLNLPGPGWEMGTASRGEVTVGHIMVNLPDSFSYFWHREPDGKTRVQVPFQLGIAVKAGLVESARPIVISLQVVDKQPPLIFLCGKMVEANDEKLIAESDLPPFHHAQHSDWVLQVSPSKAGEKPLRISAKNDWIATGEKAAAFILFTTLFDQRIHPGASCAWTSDHLHGGKIQGSGVITFCGHHFDASYTILRVEWS